MKQITDGLMTSHSLAKELLSKEDGIITASYGEEEYVINSLQRIRTCANLDDSVSHWVFTLRECGKGNIKR